MGSKDCVDLIDRYCVRISTQEQKRRCAWLLRVVVVRVGAALVAVVASVSV